MSAWLIDSNVALIKEEAHYASKAPFDASEEYPEWPNNRAANESNPAYRGVREIFRSLGFDDRNFGKAHWNPLGELIKPGNTVILKPNFVSHRNHGERAFGLVDTDSLITHGSVVRAVLDYAGKALGGSGRIIVGDCPVQNAKWDQVIALAALNPIADCFRRAFPKIELKLHDYRLARAQTRLGWVTKRIVDEKQLSEYQEVDLERRSLLLPLMEGKEYRFGVAQYPQWRMRHAHTPSANRYIFPKELLLADVMINLPKMKAHQKAGVTCALKNFVGVNGHKDYLPHFRYGSPKEGGDEYPDGNLLWDLMWRCAHLEWEREGGNLKTVYRILNYLCQQGLRVTGMPAHHHWVGGGSWHGNDTLWRTVLDINRAFFYFDSGTMRVDTAPRKDVRYLAILDGLIGGELESPLAPSPIKSGWMIAGQNPVALDCVAIACMGFDMNKLPQIREAFALRELSLAAFTPSDVRICGNTGVTSIKDIYKRGILTPFTPSRGFRGFLEYDGSDPESMDRDDIEMPEFSGPLTAV